MSHRCAVTCILSPPCVDPTYRETTANLPDESLPAMSSVTQTGVYYGYAQVLSVPKDGEAPLRDEDRLIHPMVMSLGWNPFYKNKQLTAVSNIAFVSFSLSKQHTFRKFTLCTTTRKTFTAMK
jgi:FAD synthase